VTKLFVTGHARGLEGAVHAVRLALRGAAEQQPWGAPWWRREDWSLIHVGLHRKAYWVRNNFLFFVVPELCQLESKLQMARHCDEEGSCKVIWLDWAAGCEFASCYSVDWGLGGGYGSSFCCYGRSWVVEQSHGDHGESLDICGFP